MVVSQLRPDPHVLADPGTDLRELIRPPLRPPLHPPQGQA
jgi:hypothetical protein